MNSDLIVGLLAENNKIDHDKREKELKKEREKREKRERTELLTLDYTGPENIHVHTERQKLFELLLMYK